MLDRLIPYSAEVYQAQFAFYYLDTSPTHLVALPFGFVIAVMLARHSKRGPVLSRLIIAAFWIWTGAVFHDQYLVDLNWAAPYFGYIFVAQGMLIAAHTVLNRAEIHHPPSRTRVIGVTLVVLSMALSPTIAAILETPISHAHLFGITPLPLIIATMGVFSVTLARIPSWLLIIPVLWTVWEALTTQTLGLWHDFALSMIALTVITGWIAYERHIRE